MTKFTFEEVKKYNWGFSDGTQPLKNGETGIFKDDEGNVTLIESCGNCGDFSFITLNADAVSMINQMSK